MDLATRKRNFIEKISKVDADILQQLENVLALNNECQDWYKVLSAQEKEEIEIGLKQVANDEFSDHLVVMEKFKKWH